MLAPARRGWQEAKPGSRLSCALSGHCPPALGGTLGPCSVGARSPSNCARPPTARPSDAEIPLRYEAARACQVTSFCSLPHLIALPCQTRAERAKAPSPVPRSISWQSFESNCDCSALRSSEQQLLYLPTRPASSCPAQPCSALLWHPASLPRPGLASLSHSSPTSSRDCLSRAPSPSPRPDHP